MITIYSPVNLFEDLPPDRPCPAVQAVAAEEAAAALKAEETQAIKVGCPGSLGRMRILT